MVCILIHPQLPKKKSLYLRIYQCIIAQSMSAKLFPFIVLLIKRLGNIVSSRMAQAFSFNISMPTHWSRTFYRIIFFWEQEVSTTEDRKLAWPSVLFWAKYWPSFPGVPDMFMGGRYFKRAVHRNSFDKRKLLYNLQSEPMFGKPEKWDE